MGPFSIQCFKHGNGDDGGRRGEEDDVEGRFKEGLPRGARRVLLF